MKKKLLLSLLFLFMAAPIAACKGGDNISIQSISEAGQYLPNEPITDSVAFKYESDYLTKEFTTPTSGLAYGKATLLSCTDGDTVNFRTSGSKETVKLRFLGVNTPESTAKVEPWGVKASKFTSEKLTGAKYICLVNDIDTYTKFDSSGGRYLGFIWYKYDDAASWKLLNLELVEQCFSRNQLFTDSKTLKYLDAFLKADEVGKASKYRVYGTKDPDYDYSSTTVEATLYSVRHRYSELGIDSDLGSSGKQLRVKALVVGQIGDNMILRDIVRDVDQEPEDPYTCLYAYAGYNSSLSSLVSLGDFVYFYCRATAYPKGTTNYQLSDLKTSSYGSQKFVIMASIYDTDYKKTLADNYNVVVQEDLNMDPVNMDSTSVTGKEVLEGKSGLFVETQVTVRNVQSGDYDDDGNFIASGDTKYYNAGKSGTTIYAYIKGTKVICNLRIDSTAFPAIKYTQFGEGRSFNIKGYMVPYYNNYQIQLLNNIREMNYFSEIVE